MEVPNVRFLKVLCNFSDPPESPEIKLRTRVAFVGILITTTFASQDREAGRLRKLREKWFWLDNAPHKRKKTTQESSLCDEQSVFQATRRLRSVLSSTQVLWAWECSPTWQHRAPNLRV